MVRAAHRVLSNSPFGSRRIQAAYGRPATVIEHGVDFSAPSQQSVESLRCQYGLADKRVAVTVNHLHPRKRIDLFLQAARVAAGKVPGTVALVVGGGPERAALEQLAAQLGMRVGHDAIFTGPVPEEMLPAHYALGDVYVHTGLQESFGLSVIEALSLGLPVVSVDEGGPQDTVQDGVSGYLVPSTPEALGAAVATLLTDPQRSKEMGRAGAIFVATHFDWRRGARTLLAVFRNVGTRLAPPREVELRQQW
jgi:phosphatidylinositol alpha-1,6-mannosyltransferase